MDIVLHWVLVGLLGVFIIGCLYVLFLCYKILREPSICEAMSWAVLKCKAADYKCKQIERETNLNILLMQRKR
jgi:hypothetical protein